MTRPPMFRRPRTDELAHPQPLAPLEAAAARPGPSDGEQALLAELLEKFSQLPGLLRQSAIDDRWSQIPFYVKEATYNPAAVAGVPVSVQPRTQTTELITNVLVSCPTGGGIITLGDVAIPVPAGVTSFGTDLLLSSTDTRALQVAQNGPASLLLTGVQVPTFGAIG